MKTKFTHVFIALLLFSVAGQSAYAGQQKEKTLKKKEVANSAVFFQFDKSTIDENFKNNKKQLEDIQSVLTKTLVSPYATIDSIRIVGVTSPEGVESYNEQLANRRARSLQSYITTYFPELSPSMIYTTSEVSSWSSILPAVKADNNVPNQEKVEEVIANKDLDAAQIESRIKSNKRSFNYISKNILPNERRANFMLYYTMQQEQPPIVITEPRPEEDYVVEQEVVITEERIAVQKERNPVMMAIKTNVPALAVTIPNLGVEFGFGGHFSIDIPVYFRPFTISDSYKLDFWAVQPEFRYWLKQPMKGHFFGLHAHVGDFDIAWDKQIRRKTVDPMWGLGLSYGYAVQLGKHWNAEFNIGAGYANAVYNAYDNRPGADHNKFLYKSHKHYFGITRAAVSLVYKFNLCK